MKKFISFILVLVSVLGLTSCGIKGKETLRIEFFEWKMRAVMSNDAELADDAAIIVAVGEPDELYPDAKVVDITLTANHGEITLVDATNNKTYSGTYEIKEETSKEILYDITLDGITGYAVLSLTGYYDGTQIHTLPINLGEYSVYFLPNESTAN